MPIELTAKLKVIYLFLLAIGLFFIQQIEVIGLIALLQCMLWVSSKISFNFAFKAIFRLKWFILLIVISYLLIPPNTVSPSFSLDVKLFVIDFYLSGLEHAALMLSRVILLVISSLWIRLSEPSGVFVEVLQRFGVPSLIAIVIDAGLSITSGDRSKRNSGGAVNGSGKGKDKKGKFKKTIIFFDDLKQGRLAFMDNLIAKAFDQSRLYMNEHYPQMKETVQRDASIILMVVLAIMSLKLFQLMPGLPFAPGHKNILVLPLLVLASMTVSHKFGGFSAGFSVGVVSFLLGYGKFGVFEVFQFALPGLIADILLPVLVTGAGSILMFKLVILGAILGLTRFVANFMVLILVGTPELAWVVFLPMLLSQIIFGALSCLVCVYLVKAYRNNGLPIGTN